MPIVRRLFTSGTQKGGHCGNAGRVYKKKRRLSDVTATDVGAEEEETVDEEEEDDRAGDGSEGEGDEDEEDRFTTTNGSNKGRTVYSTPRAVSDHFLKCGANYLSKLKADPKSFIVDLVDSGKAVDTEMKKRRKLLKQAQP